MKLTALKLGLLSCLTAGAAFAGPINLSQMDAEAGWGVHLDIDRLKETQLGKHFLDELQKPDAQQKLAWFQTFIGFDPLKAVHGVTLVGGVVRQEDGVLLITGDFDTNRLDQMPKSWSDYQGGQHGNHTVHSWTDQNKPGQPRTFGAIAGNTIILSQKPGLVEDTLDVIDGTKPSLSGKNPFDGLGVNDTKAFLVGGVSKIKQMGANPVASMVKQLKFIGLVASEENGQIQIELPLRASDPDAAQSFGDIFRGFIGVLKLQSQNADAALLGNAIKVAQKESTIITSLKMSTDDVLRLADEAKQKKLFH